MPAGNYCDEMAERELTLIDVSSMRPPALFKAWTEAEHMVIGSVRATFKSTVLKTSCAGRCLSNPHARARGESGHRASIAKLVPPEPARDGWELGRCAT